MLTTLRKVGNSRGILIPAAFIASCQIEDQVEMLLQDDQIVIKSAKRPLRAGWFSPVQDAALSADERQQTQAWDGTALSGDEEWVW